MSCPTDSQDSFVFASSELERTKVSVCKWKVMFMEGLSAMSHDNLGLILTFTAAIVCDNIAEIVVFVHLVNI